MIFEENQTGTLHFTVFNEIEKNILNGTYKSGEQLTEKKLSEDLGVSRTPIREALRQLEYEGLVKAIPNKGVTVMGFSEKEIIDIYKIREGLEGLAARLASENATKKEIVAMKETVELQLFYAEKNESEKVWELDRIFHKQLYAACKSRPLQSILSMLHNYLQKPREISMTTGNRASISAVEHQNILKEIIAKNGDNADKAARDHVSAALSHLLECRNG